MTVRRAFDGESTGRGEAECDRARQNERVASLFLRLTAQNARIERMMQDEGAAAQRPKAKREAHPCKRGGSDRRQDVRILCEGAFEQHRKPARQQFGMTARDRHDAAVADVERDDGDVRGGIAAPLAIGRRSSVELHPRTASSNDTMPSGRFVPNPHT